MAASAEDIPYLGIISFVNAPSSGRWDMDALAEVAWRGAVEDASAALRSIS